MDMIKLTGKTYSTKQVGKMFGISRKTLIGYKDIGLVVPKDKKRDSDPEKDKWWTYTEENIIQLQLVSILKALGYKRKEIKELMNPGKTADEEEEFYNKIHEELKNKREDIDRKIKYVEKYLRPGKTEKFLQEQDVPLETYISAGNALMGSSTRGGFGELMKRVVASDEALNTEDPELMRFTIYLLNLVSLNGTESPESEKAQGFVSECCKSIRMMVARVEEVSLEDVDVSETEIAEVCSRMMSETYESEEGRERIEEFCGEGGLEYASRACEYYRQQLRKG